VPTPDYIGRKEILDLYLGKILSKDVDVEILARGTTGFTGADLENMVNQAALRAAIDGADSVTMKYLENARDKVLMGMQRLLITVVLKGVVGQDSSVDSLQAGWSGDRIPVGGEIFGIRADRPWGPTGLLYNGYQVSFPGVKRPGRGIDHPPASSAEGKERIELYLCFPSGSSWPVKGGILPLPSLRGVTITVQPCPELHDFH